MLVVLTTVPNAAAGEELAQRIIEAKLAACVQILPPITSVYVWEGKIHKEQEYLALIKTLEEKFDDLSSCISKNHSYEVPEIVAIATDKVSGPYLQWLRSALDL